MKFQAGDKVKIIASAELLATIGIREEGVSGQVGILYKKDGYRYLSGSTFWGIKSDGVVGCWVYRDDMFRLDLPSEEGEI